MRHWARKGVVMKCFDCCATNVGAAAASFVDPTNAFDKSDKCVTAV